MHKVMLFHDCHCELPERWKMEHWWKHRRKKQIREEAIDSHRSHCLVGKAKLQSEDGILIKDLSLRHSYIDLFFKPLKLKK